MVDLVCVRAFGTYLPGDSAGSVPDDAAYDTYYYAPADHPVAVAATDSRAAQIAALEAELAALEEENQ